MKPLRYAHNEGHTDLCFEESGRYMLTCGTDGDVRIWQGIDDDDTISHRVGDKVYSITFKNGRFFTASDSNSIQAHTFPEGLPDGIVTRFTSPVHHMLLNESGTTMVAGSSDFTIKIVDIESSSHKVCRGHEAPVLSLALDPKEEFLASSSCDGSIRIWKMDDQSCIKVLNLLPKTNDVSLSKSLSRIIWTKDGEYLLIPVDKDIQMIKRSTWEKTSTLSFPQITQTIAVMSLSPNHKYLSIGCIDGVMCIIDWQKNRFIDSHKHEKSLRITALVWNPSDNNQLAFCDIEGQLGVIDEAMSDTAVNQESEKVENKTSFEGVFDDDDDMLIQATAEKQSVLDDEASEDGLTAINKTSKPNTIEDDSDDDDFMKDIKATDKDDDDDASSIVSAVQSVRPLPLADAYKPTPLQKAFQPGSTPVHLSSRFMKWNCVGIIRQYNNDEENSIDVEFHDTSTHHPLHISNNMDYTMADLSSEAVVLASHSYDDTPSKLTCMHFGSWDNAKEWSISMPDDEDIQAVTIGNGWLAVATSTRNVRVFTVAGLQQDTFIIPGPLVSMAAKNNKLILVYHRGMGIPGEQLLGVSLLTVGSRKRTIFNDIPLPISPKTTLTWIGFSEEGTPFSVDSSGILRMLNKGLGFQWSQVANTKDQAKGKSDHYWIVSLHENPQQIRCIPCKGSRYPATLPRPAVAILPYQLPLCEMNTEKSQFEECLLRCKLFSHNLPADSYELEEVLKPSQEALMKLFALAVRSDREQRALEVCKLMSEDHTLQLAIKYASRLRKLQLAERISQLAQDKTDEVEEEEEEDNLFNTVNYQADDWSNTNGHVIEEEPMEEEVEDEIVDDNIEEREEADGQDQQPTGLLLNTKPKPKTAATAAAPLIGRSNPFKISTQEKIKQPVKGTQVFDGMNKKIEKPKSTSIMPISTKISKTNQKKIPSQSKLFTAKGEKSKTDVQKTCKNKSMEESSNKKCPNAFELWLEDNKTDLEEEHPDLSEEDFGSMATEQFRSLSKDDRQVWIQKAKSLKADAKNGDENTEQKKRKREDEDADIKPSNKKSQKETDIKKPLSQSTNAKLSNFAFSKD